GSWLSDVNISPAVHGEPSWGVLVAELLVNDGELAQEVTLLIELLHEPVAEERALLRADAIEHVEVIVRVEGNVHHLLELPLTASRPADLEVAALAEVGGRRDADGEEENDQKRTAPGACGAYLLSLHRTTLTAV